MRILFSLLSPFRQRPRVSNDLLRNGFAARIVGEIEQEKLNLKKLLGMAGLIALFVLVAMDASHAYMQKQETPGKSLASNQNNKSQLAGKKLVDINSAGIGELKSLRGIDDAMAVRIIAGRPYPSKAKLVTDNIIPAGLYMSLKQQIIARQK